MTTFKTFKFGPYTFKSYYKPVGNGFEVGFTHKNRNYFVGNFVHQFEAKQWWGYFNAEIKSFATKNPVTSAMPFTWYCNFLSNHMYTCYYTWLDKMFTKHEFTFKKAYNKDYKKFMNYKKSYKPSMTKYAFKMAS